MDELDAIMQQEEEVVSEENLTPDVENEEVLEENTNEETQIDDSPKNEIPLHTFLEEKRRRKELEKRLREFEQEKMSKDKIEKIEKIRSMAKEKGYDDDYADLMGKFADELLSAIPKAGGKSEDDLLVEEIRDAQDYSGLKDAMKYKDQIVARMKKNNLTVEEAYKLEVGYKTKELASEKRTQEEQIAAIKRRQASGDSAINASSGSSKTQGTSLNSEDRKLFEFLKKTQPNNNWTAEKFAKYKQMYT